MKIMEYMKLSINPNAIVGSLSVAEKQLVEIAKAISTDSKIIVFDEPTSALTDREIERLFEIIVLSAESVPPAYAARPCNRQRASGTARRSRAQEHCLHRVV